MNLHSVRWDEEHARWRRRLIRDVDRQDPLLKLDRQGHPWLAWHTPRCFQGRPEFVEVESVAAEISPDGEITVYYRPALEYWENVNFKAACHVRWLKREWPSYSEVALEQLNTIAQALLQENASNRSMSNHSD